MTTLNSSLGKLLSMSSALISFLSSVTPQNQAAMKTMIDNFNCVEDCPIFADMYDFCKMYAGASLAGARKLCAGTTDIAINWSGGLHHAKRGEASGFCYVNDIVLGILELLRYVFRRVFCQLLKVSGTTPASSTSTSTFITETASNSRSTSQIAS